MTPEPTRSRAVAYAAAFDFDGTLTDGDTLLPFLRSVVGIPRLTRGLAGAAWAARTRDEAGRASAKAALLRSCLRGIPMTQLRKAGRAYADDIIGSTRLRPGLLTRLAEHRLEGHRTVIVSASLDLYLEPIAQFLGCELIACRLGSYRSGRCNGELVGPNVRGDTKAIALQSLLGDPRPILYAYGNDPVGDGAMLALADHPHLVHPHRIEPLAIHPRTDLRLVNR